METRVSRDGRLMEGDWGSETWGVGDGDGWRRE